MSERTLHKLARDLLRQLEEVFAGTECPQWDEVTPRSHTWEFEEFYNNGPPCDWRDLTQETLECKTDILCFLEPKGFLFFFPAFMSCSLREYLNSGTEGCIWYCVRTLVRQHEHLEEGRSFELSEQATVLLSPKQKEVLRDFLVFAKQMYSNEELSDPPIFSNPELVDLIEGTLQDTRIYLNQ